MNKILIFLLIIAGAVIFTVGGGGLGILYQTQKDAPQIGKLQATELALNNIVKELSSTVISSIISYGKVSKIEGRNITLTFEKESLTIKVREDALVFSMVQTAPLKNGSAFTTTQQKAEFKDIKLGDDLNIRVKLSIDGQLEGGVIIIPSLIQKR